MRILISSLSLIRSGRKITFFLSLGIGKVLWTINSQMLLAEKLKIEKLSQLDTKLPMYLYVGYLGQQ